MALLTEARKETLRKYNNTPERKAYMRTHYQANKEHHNKCGAEWRRKNPERCKELYKEKYIRNKDTILEQSRALYHRTKRNPQLIVKNLFGGAKRRSREKGLLFSLTKEWVMERVLAGKCEVSGLEFSSGDGMHHPYSPTIDRIDISFGYVPENCRLVIWAVNNLKGVGSDETMIVVAKAIAAKYS